MRRTVSSQLVADILDPADVVIAVAVAAGSDVEEESLRVTLDGRTLEVRDVLDDEGSRLHCVDAIGLGQLFVDYHAVVGSRAAPAGVSEIDPIRYLRPSRYCESDRLAPTARNEFGGLRGAALLDAVSSWVGRHLAYVAGSSRPTDGAVATLLARQGVCRDFAHLVVALLRACDVPARVVSVYAPGLAPMDFHAVAEVLIDGEWLVVDATCLAPRSAMVRIATGRDAADSAFLTVTRGSARLTSIWVSAICNDTLPFDDLNHPERLG
ncbi:MAG: transglutaminase family protein [Ilumatobacteraceae bacterium]